MRVSQHRDKPEPAPKDHYEQMHRSLRWQVPALFNIADVCSRRWAQAPDATKRIAVYANEAGGSRTFHTYAELQHQANRLSGALAALGVGQGDRVAIVMPQRFETAVAYMAVLQMGAVAMPLSMLFGPEALEYRLQDSESAVAICDDTSILNLLEVRGTCPQLRHVLGVGGGADAMADLDYAALLAEQTGEFAAVPTRADDAAVLIYTSGTTGNPKGALIPHRALIGNLSGFVCSQNWFGFDPNAKVASSPLPEPATQSVFWSPADWAWTGGLMDALLPTLYFGRPIVAYRGRFSPQTSFELMQTYGVTHAFLFPTALKAMMKAFPHPREFFQLKLQAIMSAGEAVGDTVFDYCERELGVTVNEMFGQTEINYIVGNCSMNMAPTLVAARTALPPEGAQPALGRPGGGLTAVCPVVGWPAKPGSMGRGYPGHRVAVIDEAGQECPVGVAGDVALNRFDVHGDPDPIFFLGYWKNEAATQAKFTGDWCRTGDLATRDADGYLWYQGRADDVFKAAGYRIGPGEIENCLVKHPSVANAAVVPKPDAERGAVVKAYVVLTPEAAAVRGDEPFSRAEWETRLVKELQRHVKGKLAPYEYPKEIEFVDALPMTTTGKVQRRVLRLQEEARARAAADHASP
jgi:acetyl-CoA synthetase